MFTFIEDYDVQEIRRIACIDGKIEAALNIIKEFKISVTKAMEITNLPESERKKVIDELKRLNIPYKN